MKLLERILYLTHKGFKVSFDPFTSPDVNSNQLRIHVEFGKYHQIHIVYDIYKYTDPEEALIQDLDICALTIMDKIRAEKGGK